MITAAIFPTGKLDDQTVDQVVTTALNSGLVACNAMTGPFRIAFFQPQRIPAGWAKFGVTSKDITPCAA